MIKEIKAEAAIAEDEKALELQNEKIADLEKNNDQKATSGDIIEEFEILAEKGEDRANGVKGIDDIEDIDEFCQELDKLAEIGDSKFEIVPVDNNLLEEASENAIAKPPVNRFNDKKEMFFKREYDNYKDINSLRKQLTKASKIAFDAIMKQLENETDSKKVVFYMETLNEILNTKALKDLNAIAMNTITTLRKNYDVEDSVTIVARGSGVLSLFGSPKKV